MPFTPFHFGFGVFLFAICPFIDVTAILIGCVIIDIEGVLYLLFKIGALHGYTHSLLGVMIYLIPCTFFSWVFYKLLAKMMNKTFRFNWLYSGISSLLGLVSHVIFDGSLYPEMMIFYPFSQVQGHIFGIMSYQTVIIILTSMFALGVIIVIVKSLLRFKFEKKLLISYNLILAAEIEKALPIESQQ
ncbi:MAG: hypothetical protein ACTSSN_13030 [Candidatus Heimdallarchaeaceae archaeon]